MSRSSSIRSDNDNVMNAVVFDIDGVLADNSHRLAQLHPETPDWDAFHDAQHLDPPIQEQVTLLNMMLEGGFRVVLLTSRPEHYRQATVDWLATHGIEYHRLLMHPQWEVDTHARFKQGALSNLRLQFNVRLVIDDSPETIAVARSLGIPALYIHSGYYDRSLWGTALTPAPESTHG